MAQSQDQGSTVNEQAQATTVVSTVGLTKSYAVKDPSQGVPSGASSVDKKAK